MLPSPITNVNKKPQQLNSGTITNDPQSSGMKCKSPHPGKEPRSAEELAEAMEIQNE